MAGIYKKINKLWQNYAPQYFWGDPLDVRFYLCKELSKIKNKKILELGCNAGIILNCLDKSNNITGIDINEKALQIAKKINPEIQILKKDMFNLSYKNEFDVVILANVLPKHDFESNHEPEELISLAYSFLKDGGQFFLTIPNAANRYYKTRGKFVDYPYLKNLLEGKFDYSIKGWNPFPIQLGRVLKYIPGIFSLLELQMAKGIRSGKCVAFYAEAVKI
jgi:SAM-dependent methyltransferase